tara:strand:- start:65 stop:367 length:303 start_codon:yes stop_codon:yes gene_type:complete
MKLTQDIIRGLIKEAISQKEMEEKADSIFAMLSNLDGQASTILGLVNKRLAAEDQTNERKLTAPEKEKREEVAQAMEEEDPNIDMSKKMAIATAQAKKNA